MYRDKIGREIQYDELEVLICHPGYKIVKQEQLGPYFISTVWLGVPHGLDRSCYFETMVFTEYTEYVEIGEQIMECTRYYTLKEAEEGHENVVRCLVDSTGIRRSEERNRK